MFTRAYFSRAYFSSAYFSGAALLVTSPTGFDVQILMDFGNGLTNVTTDVRTADPPVCRYGIIGGDHTDRIADTGVLTFALNNGAWNSAGTLGYYAPLHAAKRGGFAANMAVQFWFIYNGVPTPKFLGKLSNMHVTPGRHADRMVHCTAVDLMDDYARVPVPALPVAFNQRGDQLLTQVLDALPADLQPAVRTIDVGVDAHPIAFDTFDEGTITIREALNQIALSDLMSVYVIAGGVVARNRQYAPLHPVVQCALTDDAFDTSVVLIAKDGLDVPGSRDDIVSKVQITVHSTRVDPDPTTVLYALENASALIAPMDSRLIMGAYRDPANPRDKVGGIDQIAPVPYTDYTMNSAVDGTGTDLTMFFSVLAYSAGAGVRFDVINTGITSGYVTKLQHRGRAIYRFAVRLEADAVPDYGRRVVQVDMPFQSSANVGQDVADHLAATESYPQARVGSVRFLANQSPAAMQAAITLEPGSSRISITEAVTGLVAEEFGILSVEYRIQPAAQEPLLWCTWFVEPLSAQQVMVLGSVGASELGVTTVLGY